MELKIKAITGKININSIKFKTSGNYSNSDITDFGIYTSNTNNLAYANYQGSTLVSNSAGQGETLTFNNPNYYSNLDSMFVWLMAKVSSTANIGKTIKVNGLQDPTLLTTNTSAILVNNQSDIVGFQTIEMAKVEISTINYPAKDISKNSYYIPFMV